MADFFDSSVLIGLLLADCPEHAACAEAWMRSSERVVCSHGLLETFSQLTGGRLGVAVPPDAASESINRTMRAGLVRVMVFDSEELFSHLESTRRVGARGGAVYDFMHVCAARKAEAERIYSLNKRHFFALAPDLAPRILHPAQV